MSRRPLSYRGSFGSLSAGTLVLALLASCSGSDGAAGPPGPPGPPGSPAINAWTTPDSILAELDLDCEITGVTIQSPPVVDFTLKTVDGVPIVGLVPFWESNPRFIRFTVTKLLPSENGEPKTWVNYVQPNGTPTYDTGATLVDNEDGSYTFTFETDVTAVDGIDYEPSLTHRVAGQIGQLSTVALEEQNVWFDFVPDGSVDPDPRDIVSTATCNECHDELTFHGRRRAVEYCVQCHNPDLAEGEGDFSFMIHRIHAAGDFFVLDDAISYEEVTYPQTVANCRKCHNGDDEDTADGDNWRARPNMQACSGCHNVFGPNATASHRGGDQADNSLCFRCHPPEIIEGYHVTPNSTPNNPMLPEGQRNISYEMVSAAVDGMTNDVTIEFRILSEDTPLDMTNLPMDLTNGMGAGLRYPGLLLAYALPQGSMMEPTDWNNLGQDAAQPISLGLDSFSPIATMNPLGTIAFDGGTGVNTVTITDAASQFPVGAMMRAVGLQGYLQQDLDNDGASDVSLHALSDIVTVTGDAARRQVFDPTKCANCHEWFEGHGGNRVFGAGSAEVCTMCHNPNLSSSGRTVNAFFTGPEDAQNFKDMIHGIHSGDFRSRDYEHVRNFRGNGSPYNWSEVTYPQESNNCSACHIDGSTELPLADSLLPTTVRTTGSADGLDMDEAAVTAARAGGALPNATDWINTPTASSCFYCHTSGEAWAHMTQQGAQLSMPSIDAGIITNRSDLMTPFESCAVCHGPGKSADIGVAHSR